MSNSLLSLAKCFILVITFLIRIPVIGQITDDQLIVLEKQIDSLDWFKENLEDSIQYLRKRLDSLRAINLRSKYENQDSVTFRGVVMVDGNLIRNSTVIDRENHIIGTVKKGDSVIIIGYSKHFWKVIFGGQIGYVLDSKVQSSNPIGLDQYKQFKTEEEAQQKRQLEEAEREEKRIERERTIEERKKRIINTYGADKGGKIIRGQVWIGMSTEMALESRGYPKRINKSTYATLISEQWVYDFLYLYFENGILTSYSTHQ